MRKRLFFALVLLVVGVAACFAVPRTNIYTAKAQGTTTGMGGPGSTGEWNINADVTTVGKAAARARESLNWALAIKDSGFSQVATSPSADKNPAIYDMWKWVMGVLVVLYVLILIIIAFGLILHLDWAERSRRVLPMLIVAFIVSFISFSIEVFTIQFVDSKLTQNFYTIHKSAEIDSATGKSVKTKNNDAGESYKNHLRAEDLLTVSFNYQDFIGYRRMGAPFDEAVKSHLFLVRLTTWTNYAVVFIIIFRIIILWGLVIFSPFMFPFLVFPLTRNVAIVWAREFFRWLLLGPLFALFLTVIPYIWIKTHVGKPNLSDTNPSGIAQYATDQKANNSGIPIEVQKNILTGGGAGEATSKNVYQSGTNILLLPPGSKESLVQLDTNLSTGNNLSETDSYLRYIIAILMVWGAIILPFLLLRIISSFSVDLGKGVTNIWNKSGAPQYLNAWRGVAPQGGPNGPKPGGGSAKPLVLSDLKGTAATIVPAGATQKMRERASILREKSVEKLSVPAILNVAGIKQVIPDAVNLLSTASNVSTEKTSSRLANLTRIEQDSQATERTREVLTKMQNPEKIESENESNTYKTIRESIRVRDVAGEKAARSIQNALTNNVSHYLNSNVNNEVQNNSVYNYLQNTRSLFNTSSNVAETQMFQNAYNTTATNLYDYLTQQSDENSVAALSALNQIREISKTANTTKEALTERDTIIAYQSANKILSSENSSTNKETTQFQALKEILERGAVSGDKNMANFLQTTKGVVNAAVVYNNRISDHFSKQTLQNITRNVDNLFQTAQNTNNLTQDQSRQLTQNFQNTYNTNTSNFHDYLSSRQDQKAQLALRALEKVKEATKTAVATSDVKTVALTLNKINHPEKLQATEQAEYSALKEEVAQGVKKGDNNLSDFQANLERMSMITGEDQALMSTGTDTLPPDITQLEKAVKNDADYTHTKELWKEHYRKAQVPLSSKIRTRADWLKKEKETLEADLTDFLSADSGKREQALKRIEKILPFILMGDYQASEIATYLLAKYEAAKEVHQEISAKPKENEEDLVHVEPKKEAQQNTMHMEAEADNPAGTQG